MGLDAQGVIVAAGCRATPRFPDWTALAERGHGEVLLHLLALARQSG
jgi:hypothetical protein